MNVTTNIPEEWKLLVKCLQCAIHNIPPGMWIANVDWQSLLRQARGHSVESYLFPWLCRHLPDQFSAHADVPEDSAQAAWRSFALDQLRVTIKRQKQTEDILSAFAVNSIDVTPLKGIWLSKKIYKEASQRKMVDIDLLVKKEDRKKAVTLLTELGYTSKRAMQESEFMCDLSFYHPAYDLFMELHWNVECKMSGERKIPEINTILQRTSAAELFGQPIKRFPIEDQLCNLVQHILHHQFALSLRSYIDIGLLLNAEKLNISREKLDVSAVDWKTGKAVPFILKLVTDLFDLNDIPKDLTQTTIKPDILQSAVTAVFELPLASSRDHEVNLLKYSQTSPVGKLKLTLNRIFMPQAFMRLHYPFAQNKILLPFAWFLRALFLIRTSGSKLVHTKSSDPRLSNASTRAEIIKELTEKEL